LGAKPRPVIDLHFVQLPLHNILLSMENPSAYDGSDGYDGGQKTYPSGPARHNALVLIMGIMRFFAGCIMMVTAICGVDYAEDRGFPWFFPICAFGCPAVWLIWTGTGNLLS
jgi:hypothetical protein